MAAKRPRSSRADRAAPKEAADLRMLARDAALAALKRLADLSRSEDERVALAATQELLNRAFGKAAAPGAGEDAAASRPLIVKIVRFGDVETNDSDKDTQP
jgi:hypothetical protein